MGHMLRARLASMSVGLACLVAGVAWTGDRSLGFVDLMQFRQIEDTVIADGGGWVAYVLAPDRGDGEVVVRSTGGETEHRIERGAAPQISADGRWVAAAITPTLEDRERSEGADDAPKPGLAILDLASGQEERIDEVESFAFSAGGRWLAYQPVENDEEGSEEDECREASPAQEPEDDEEIERELGSDLVLRNLGGGSDLTISHVVDFVFAESAPLLAVTVAGPEGEGNGVQLHDLRGEQPVRATLHAETGEHATHPTWAEEAGHLAFVVAADDEGKPVADAEIWIWTGSGEARRVASKTDAPVGFTVPSVNELQWSRDGRRLFFGFKPVGVTDTATATAAGTDADADAEEPFDPYDVDAILADREVDVWHWRDPRIIPNQKERWDEHEKDRVYRAVVHLDDGKVVPLADLELPEVEPTDNPRVALGRSDLPYLREITWDGRFADLYAVDLQTGERRRFAERIAGGWRAPSASLSPDGTHALYYDDGDWHLYATAEGTTRNLTADLPVSFADEDWDYPADPPGYGHAEWFADSHAIMVYDKYDIWSFNVRGGDGQRSPMPLAVTGGAGRTSETVFRVIDTDSETETIDPNLPLLLEAFDDREKIDRFVVLESDNDLDGVLADGRHRLSFLGKAKNAERFLFSRESYTEFPDLWVADSGFENVKKISDVNPQIADYAWGSAELVEWTTDDGTELQGVLITPEGREPGERVPVLVYYYRFFSHRLHLFNEPVVNHRPSFPVYASSGYAVFLPDIRFQVGRPGPSAVECLTSGIEHLVKIGVADPEAVGLHGHSWSGYQTAYVVTQTDVFAAAVAGAPVSNMTSAYSGIRLGTGLARQFQYEKSQSRIGGSLWETPELYIENSPVFFADEIDTPLLIQFGDEDEAVPWQQGIELYLACRRLDKDCIMLQYRGEPHHLKKTANKLDYSIKMKQFFDHHLKGEPAPVWMTEGVPYRGE